ncbi:zinc-binding alcohol dehydrogenase family protein [Enterococcus casseliflavus]|uniref:zinc-binding alcohol dehydrogenase family protein n=1 Tax=Enterococcus casseliflavus TaxID=37734 RepID=UPI0009C045AF|nr:zinc-binding alcohol dehydrogenase family protein [Enterococcus casseliflavus]MBO6384354.1 zinc-binding alcohol dehydrogenase family protein [Enterococcus casseliflavus]OQO86996.1 NADPH:quinone reductase [Enterococcus casseliflavus]
MMKNKALGFYEGRSLDESNIFIEKEIPIPNCQANDLLVEVQAVSVNPIDTKRRQMTALSEAFQIQGYDAVGIVKEIGSAVNGFAVGDRVFYAGTTQRPGANQRFQTVDSRIAAKAPAGFSDGDLAAMPLTSITAWELLFEKFGYVPEENANDGSILLVNASGGVGSIAAQLAKWAGLTVYGTASPKNDQWLKNNQVDQVLNHRLPLAEQITEPFSAVAIFYDASAYLPQLTKAILPFGKVGMIVNSKEALDLNPFKNLGIDFYWEYMFAKTDAQLMIETQGSILQRIASLLADKKIHTTAVQTFNGGITIETLKLATKAIEQGTKGKTVITGGVR